MTLKKKISCLIISLVLSLSQVGCIVGFICPPLWIGSIVLLASGNHGTLMWVLGAKNLGRADAFNELPMDLDYAKAAHVKMNDIKSYNRDLEQIRKVGIDLANDIQSQMDRPELRHVSSVEQLSRDPQIDRLANKYGFENGDALFDSFKGKALPAQTVVAFAKNVNMTEGQARLLLHYGFAIKAE
jgi:hypothetical protein